MKTAFVVPYNRGGPEFEKELDMLGELGFHAVEVSISDPSCFDTRQVRLLTRANHLDIAALGPGKSDEKFSLCTADNAVRGKTVTRIKEFIDISVNFGCLVIIGPIRGCLDDNEHQRKQSLGRAVECLRECCDYASEKGCRALALEPLNRYETNFVQTVQDGLELIKQIKSKKIGLCLDTFHMNIEEANLGASIAAAGRAILHVHIADNNRWPPGMGHLDLKTIIRSLQRVGYDGYVSAEVHRKPNAETCARQTMESLNNLDVWSRRVEQQKRYS